MNSLWVNDIDFLISPYGCFGRPHQACLNEKISVIVVHENQSSLNNVDIHKDFIVVENYLEAAGYIMAKKSGIHPSSVRRPLENTKIINI